MARALPSLVGLVFDFLREVIWFGGGLFTPKGVVEACDGILNLFDNFFPIWANCARKPGVLFLTGLRSIDTVD
jgi:hypothetical protein